ERGGGGGGGVAPPRKEKSRPPLPTPPPPAASPGHCPAPAPPSAGSGPDDLNAILQALYLVELMSHDFLGDLLEVVGGQAAAQDQHAALIVTGNVFQGRIATAA